MNDENRANFNICFTIHYFQIVKMKNNLTVRLQNVLNLFEFETFENLR